MDILAIATVAFTLAGFVKGVVGFGFPVISLVILTLTIGLLDALAISLRRNELISVEHIRLSLFALVPSILGLYIGRWIKFRIDEERFQQIFLGSVLLLGAYISYRSVVAM